MTNSEEAIRHVFAERAVKSESGTTLDATDGRVANRLRNRDKVIDTYIELINEGQTGSLEQIVERSGVARRSVFRYFTDLSDLAMSAFQRIVGEAASIAFYNNPGVGTLEMRIDEVVRVRMAAYAQTHLFGLMARRRLTQVDGIEAGLRVISEIMQAQLREQFEPELSVLDAEVSARLLDALSLVVSFESYDLFVRQLGRSLKSVEATWRDALRLLLAN